jgi:hypothetical protein
MKEKSTSQKNDVTQQLSEEIKNKLDHPLQLEKLYRDNANTFKRAFKNIYPVSQIHLTAQIWNERLNFEQEEISWGNSKDLYFVIITALIAGLIAKIPDFTGMEPDYFYPRNISFVVFPALAAFFAWKQKLQIKSVLIVFAVFVISAIYINILPNDTASDTLILACIHLPLLLWSLLGFTFTGQQFNSYDRRLDFLRFNGDLLVMTTIILIAGGLLTGITFGLFELIDIKIEAYYLKYFGIWGLAAAPVLGTYLVQTNPQLVNKVSPVIAKVFTPLVIITLVIYLAAVISTGKDPFNDREFLLIFNVLLIGVMAIILFSISETSKNSESKIGIVLLFILSFVTIIVNGIALSAILFRISEWGITPNRLAVLGGNILILINLLIVALKLFKTIRDKNEIEGVEKSIASYLIVYILWAIVVTFIFPIVFSFS